MKVLLDRCAGLDLADDGLVAGVRIQESRTSREECRGFPTTTRGLLDLSEWLTERGVTK